MTYVWQNWAVFGPFFATLTQAATFTSGRSLCDVQSLQQLPMNDPGGSRTRDLRIKSPLLYQLSYRVENRQRVIIHGFTAE